MKSVVEQYDDHLYGCLAQGVLYSGADAYDIEGEILDIRVDGSATTYLDGKQVDPRNLRKGPIAHFLPTSDEVTISPAQGIHFLATAPYQDVEYLDLYVNGQWFDASYNVESTAWPGPVHSMSWGTDTPGTYQVEAVSSNNDDVMVTWDVTVTQNGNSSPAVTSFSEGEGNLSSGNSTEFTVQVEDADADLSHVAWFAGYADYILDVAQVSGETDSATVTVEPNDLGAGGLFTWMTDESGVQSEWVRIYR